MKKLKQNMLTAVLLSSVFLLQACGGNTDLSQYSNQSSAAASAARAPSISGSSTPGSVGFFQPAVLSVVASGDNLVYQWFKNGSPIAGANGPSFSVASAVATDAGTYTVRINNEVGSIESSPLPLNVVRLQSQQGPPVITAATGNLMVPLDYGAPAPVDLSVTATGIGLTYEWRVTYIDYSVNLNNTVPSTKLFSTSQNTKTHIAEYTYDGVVYKYTAVGTYTVTVKNYFGETASRTFNVEFIIPNFNI